MQAHMCFCGTCVASSSAGVLLVCGVFIAVVDRGCHTCADSCVLSCLLLCTHSFGELGYGFDGS